MPAHPAQCTGFSSTHLNFDLTGLSAPSSIADLVKVFGAYNNRTSLTRMPAGLIRLLVCSAVLGNSACSGATEYMLTARRAISTFLALHIEAWVQLAMVI
jgi:hypothetical protein